MQELWQCQHNEEMELKRIDLEENEKIKFIKYGIYHVIIITYNNEIFCFGGNEEGQLGTSNHRYHRKFTKITNNFGKITHLECGPFFSIIVNNNNELFGTGRNNNCAFGLQTLNRTNTFTKINTKFLDEIVLMRCGLDFTLIVTKNHDIYGTGNNRVGQLGCFDCRSFPGFSLLENINVNIKDLQCGRKHSVILDKFGNIYGTGTNKHGELGLGSNINNITKFTMINLTFKVKSIATFHQGTFLINEYGELFGTGGNSTGNLGVGDTIDRFSFTKIILNGGADVRGIFNSFAYNNCMLITTENKIYGCGMNCLGHLGIPLEFCKLNNEDTDDSFHYVDTFKKITAPEIDTRKYVTLVHLQHTRLFAISNCKDINQSYLEEENKLGKELIKKLTLLNDIAIDFCTKKRKWDDYLN